MRSNENNKPGCGEKIQNHHGKLLVPDHPVIPFIIGDGIGKDIWKATKPVLDTAVALAYQNQRHLHWLEVSLDKDKLDFNKAHLLKEAIKSFREYSVGLKGPLATPVGEGFRSLNVRLRHELDLYVCMRPITYIPGSPSPVCHPERVDMVIFRENTEDIYTGIEFEVDTKENQALLSWLRSNYPDQYNKIRFPHSSGIGIKPISREGSQRLIRAAINYALKHQRKRLMLVHKGNIMKFTEGAFAKWGYDLAETEFAAQVFTQRQYEEIKMASGEENAEKYQYNALNEGKIIVNDVITDAAFEQTLTRPEFFDIIATSNLNGDFLSDALAAQVGGLGISPGVNINLEENIAIFEATHGTAPSIAGKDIANPCSLILSGVMLLEHIGWEEAAELVRQAITAVLQDKLVTLDFYRLLEKATLVSTTGFGQAVIKKMHNCFNETNTIEA